MAQQRHPSAESLVMQIQRSMCIWTCPIPAASASLSLLSDVLSRKFSRHWTHSDDAISHLL